MSVPQSQLPSVVTERYAIEREIGSGGMATVFLARDLKHDREVAVKVLRPELGAVLGPDRFLSEIKITAKLDHPHIITLIDSGAAEGLLYYVLPYVRGESLRDLLNRETQLSIEDALMYTKHVGSALDYAHRQGVIHRDIKPENVLIQEGEAILTDFGIALAVKEAGGSRLTETGLSLGTPQYMSPEQATGERTMGPKSDQYSLAAVLYEMLTGEPPLGGANSQAIIAKLLTEEPTHIRTVRKTVPVGIDAAVAKALSKSPADRFGTVGDFLRALESGKGQTVEGTRANADEAPNRKRNPVLMGGIAAVVVAAIAIAAITMKKTPEPSASVALKERTQLTFSGEIIIPAISGDGKQLAYFVKACPTEKCIYSINVQDVGSTEAHTIVTGVSAGLTLEWSPDRRNLLFLGTYGGRYGSFLVSALGGKPRLLGTGGAQAFYAGGDSILVNEAIFEPDKDSAFTIKVTGLAGDVGGTWKVPGGGEGVLAIAQVPGKPWIVVATDRGAKALWQVLDREGKSISSFVNGCGCSGVASSDALWIGNSVNRPGEAILRVAIDPQTGHFASHRDTVYTGRFSGFSVSNDGTKLIVDDGATDFNVAVMSVADMMAKKFDGAQSMKASSYLTSVISPDGNLVLKRQSLPYGRGSTTLRLSAVPFGGGAEIPIETVGKTLGAEWVDSTSVAMVSSSSGIRFSVVNIRTGVRSNEYQSPESSATSVAALPNGWVYSTRSGSRVAIVQDGKKRDVMKPAWYQILTGLAVSRDMSELMFWGWNNGSNDSVGYERMPLSGGSSTRVFTTFAERGLGSWLYDGSFIARVWETPEAVTLMKISASGKPERMMTIPHVASNFNHSADMKRATINWRDTHADAFMYHVVKQ